MLHFQVGPAIIHARVIQVSENSKIFYKAMGLDTNTTKTDGISSLFGALNVAVHNWPSLSGKADYKILNK